MKLHLMHTESVNAPEERQQAVVRWQEFCATGDYVELGSVDIFYICLNFCMLLPLHSVPVDTGGGGGGG